MNKISTSWSEADSFKRFMIVVQTLLASISFLATTWGFADLLKVDLSGTLNLGKILSAIFVIAIAAAVMLAMLTGLFTMLDRDRRFVGRFTGAIAYVFFVFWSIAFGYGFFWKTFSAEEYTRAQFSVQADQIERRIGDITSVLGGIRDAANAASRDAGTLALEESTKGGSCKNNPRSTPDVCGPLCESRKSVSARASEQASRINDDWIARLGMEQAQIAWRLQALDPLANAALDAVDPPRPGRPSKADAPELDELRKLVAEGPAGRKVAYQRVQKRANDFVRQANAIQFDMGAGIRDEFKSMAAEMTTQGPRRLEHFCRDDELAAKMILAAERIEGLPEAEPLNFEPVEGAAATRFATINLGKNAISAITGLFNVKLPDAVGGQPRLPLSENDIIALYATAAIDFALLIVSILARPPAPGRSVVQRLKKGLRRGKENPFDPPDLDFVEGASERDLEVRDKAHKSRLDARQQRRRHRDDIVKEERADSLVAERLHAEAVSGGQSLVERLTLVIGDQALAVEVIRQATQNMAHVEGRHFIVLSGQESPAMRVAAKGFANYLNIHRAIYGVRALESGRGSDDRLREMIGRKLNLPANLLADVFEVDSNLGSALLLAPKGETKPALRQSSREVDAMAEDDSPPIGRLDERDFVFSNPSDGKRPTQSGRVSSGGNSGNRTPAGGGGSEPAGTNDGKISDAPRKKGRKENAPAENRVKRLADWASGLFPRSPKSGQARGSIPPASLDDLPDASDADRSSGTQPDWESATEDSRH